VKRHRWKLIVAIILTLCAAFAAFPLLPLPRGFFVLLNVIPARMLEVIGVGEPFLACTPWVTLLTPLGALIFYVPPLGVVWFMALRSPHRPLEG
jgi:hypothetical protein